MLEGLLKIDPAIADLKNDLTLLHYAVAYNKPSCAEVLLKLAPHLLNVVNNQNYAPLQYAKKNYPNSIEVIKMLEDHLKNR